MYFLPHQIPPVQTKAGNCQWYWPDIPVCGGRKKRHPVGPGQAGEKAPNPARVNAAVFKGSQLYTMGKTAGTVRNAGLEFLAG